MVDWNKPVVTADGRYGIVLPSEALIPYRRVMIDPSGKRISDASAVKNATVWHYNEDGTLNAEGAAWHLRNVA